MAVTEIEWHRRAAQRPLTATHRIAAWASDHFGLITTARLRQLGLSSREIKTLLAGGWLLPTGHRGVHRVGHGAHVFGQREAIPLAVGGRGASLTGRSGAAWRGLTGAFHGPVELLVRDACHDRDAGVRRIRPRAPEPSSVVRGLRCAGVLRTLLDLAASPGVPAEIVREALVEALRRGHDLEPLYAMCRGRRGALLLRAELEELFPDLARTLSELEARFLRLLKRHGVPLPLVNVSHQGDLLDCRWPNSRLCVELDGRRWHQSRFREDRARDRRRLREGLVPFRFTWQDVTLEEAGVLDDVVSVLRTDELA